MQDKQTHHARVQRDNRRKKREEKVHEGERPRGEPHESERQAMDDDVSSNSNGHEEYYKSLKVFMQQCAHECVQHEYHVMFQKIDALRLEIDEIQQYLGIPSQQEKLEQYLSRR